MTDINRRTALGIIGAAGGLLATGGKHSLAAAAGSPMLDLDDQAQLYSAFRKLAYSLDGSVTWWWMRGTRFGVVDSVATPFWDMYVGSWFSTRDLEDGAYEVSMAGANFYTPPNSTSLLRSFRNPYTGEEVPVNYAAPRARKTVITPENASAFGEANIPGMDSTQSSSIGPGWIEDTDVIIRGDLALTATPTDPDSDRGVFTVNDWSTYVGDLSQVADPAVKNAPCRQYFTDILTWPGWLQMGDQPGSYVSRCYGRKVFAYEQMPETWRKLFAQAQPEAARDPASLLSA
ncbi:MAG: hypothetical protein ACI87W_001783 [Halieaceae bacterium]|jgi:hypothetical protein